MNVWPAFIGLRSALPVTPEAASDWKSVLTLSPAARAIDVARHAAKITERSETRRMEPLLAVGLACPDTAHAISGRATPEVNLSSCASPRVSQSFQRNVSLESVDTYLLG